MPQLMPLYWIMSSIILFLLLIVIMKVHGNFMRKFVVVINNKIECKSEKWLW